MRRVALITVFLIVIGIGVFLGAFPASRFSVDNRAAFQITELEAKEITMAFVGDIMLSRAIGKLMVTKQDYTFPFASTSEVIHSADIAFGNLENPISEQGVLSGSIYSFRADPQVVEGLKVAGFDIVSIANNHIWDYGKDAFNDTLKNLLENEIVAVGGGENYDEAHIPKIITVGDTRIAFLAYTNLISTSLGLASSTPSVARYNDETLANDIARAKELTDFVVVSFHWGEEYKIKHNSEQERVGKLAIDSGANIVVGHHPHVIQEVEQYSGGWIAYSLGNFIFDQNFSKDTQRGLVLLVTVKDNKTLSVKEKQVAFNDDYQPYFVEEASE